MRLSTILLASSIALHGSVNPSEGTAAAAIEVNDPNQAHTSLELKNATRPQSLARTNGKTTKDEERMMALESIGLSEQNLLKIRSRLPGGSPDKIFEKLRTTAVGGENLDKVNNVLATMKTNELERAIKVSKAVFIFDEKFFVLRFIKEWGFEVVAKALVDSEESFDRTVQAKGQLLLQNLLDYWKTWVPDTGVFDKLDLGKFRNWFVTSDEAEGYAKLLPSHHAPQVKDEDLVLKFRDRFKLLYKYFVFASKKGEHIRDMDLILKEGFGVNSYGLRAIYNEGTKPGPPSAPGKQLLHTDN